MLKTGGTCDEKAGAVEGVYPCNTAINETMVAEINDAQTGKRVWFAKKEREVRRFTPTKDEHHGDLIYRGLPVITKLDIMRAGWDEKPVRKLTHFDSVIELSDLEIEALNKNASSGELLTCSDIGRVVENKIILINSDKEDQDPDKEDYSVTPDAWFAVWQDEKIRWPSEKWRYENISGAIEFWRNEFDNVHSGQMPFHEDRAFQMAERNQLITEKGSKVVYFKQSRNATAEHMYVAKVEFDEVIRKSGEMELGLAPLHAAALPLVLLDAS